MALRVPPNLRTPGPCKRGTGEADETPRGSFCYAHGGAEGFVRGAIHHASALKLPEEVLCELDAEGNGNAEAGGADAEVARLPPVLREVGGEGANEDGRVG